MARATLGGHACDESGVRLETNLQKFVLFDTIADPRRTSCMQASVAGSEWMKAGGGVEILIRQFIITETQCGRTAN